jgi:hypothetical protein
LFEDLVLLDPCYGLMEVIGAVPEDVNVLFGLAHDLDVVSASRFVD